MKRPVALLQSAVALLLSSAFLSALVPSLGGQPAQADDFLESVAGEWRGGGWAKQAADVPREAVRCRFVFTIEDRGDRLDIAGQCAGGGRRGTVSGEVASTEDGRYTGHWESMGTNMLTLSGRRDRGALIFAWRPAGPERSAGVEGQTIWQLAGDRLTITTSLEDEAAPVGELTLGR